MTRGNSGTVFLQAPLKNINSGCRVLVNWEQTYVRVTQGSKNALTLNPFRWTLHMHTCRRSQTRTHTYICMLSYTLTPRHSHVQKHQLTLHSHIYTFTCTHSLSHTYTHSYSLSCLYTHAPGKPVAIIPAQVSFWAQPQPVHPQGCLIGLPCCLHLSLRAWSHCPALQMITV